MPYAVGSESRKRETRRIVSARYRAKQKGLEGPPYVGTPPAKTPEEKAFRSQERKRRHKDRSTEYRRLNPDRRKEIYTASYRRRREALGIKDPIRYSSEDDRKQARRNTKRKYYERNKDDLRKKALSIRNQNLEFFRKKSRDYERINADKIREKRHTEVYRERVRKYHNTRYRIDPLFRISVSMRNCIRRCFKSYSTPELRKRWRSKQLIGCSIPELVDHLRSKFKPGMTLENHGEWHIDHKIPLAFFDLTDSDQLMKAMHWTNLQPFWGIENMRKGARYADV